MLDQFTMLQHNTSMYEMLLHIIDKEDARHPSVQRKKYAFSNLVSSTSFRWERGCAFSSNVFC